MTDEIEKRVSKVENEHNLISLELKQVTKTLTKIETAIEKQNEILTDVRLLRQEIKNKEDNYQDDIKDLYSKIDNINNKLWWAISTAVTSLLGGSVALLMMVIEGK